MSDAMRKNVVLAVVALLVIAMVLASTGCTSDAGTDSSLTSDTYPDAMAEICAATSSELEAVPEPPEQISRVDWAAEVSRLLDNEANRFDTLEVADELREPHGSLVRTAREQAAQLALLGDALVGDPTGSGGIDTISDEIQALTLGREALAVELGVPSCGTRALT